ncbi:2175_t:CDS:1, partial [Dentiscutata heterogama]
SFSKDIQNSLQKTKNFTEPDYSEGSNSENFIKHSHYKYSAKINHSKKQHLRIR